MLGQATFGVSVNNAAVTLEEYCTIITIAVRHKFCQIPSEPSRLTDPLNGLLNGGDFTLLLTMVYVEAQRNVNRDVTGVVV